MSNISKLREDYRRGSLEREDLHDNPFEQFRKWFDEALADRLLEPNAMVLATVDEGGHPDARVVLLKDFDERGFTFYTNYDSTKSQQLSAEAHAALVFNWLQHERQIRIRGHVTRVSLEESERYFHSRPKGSQIGAWASPQSEVIPNRSVLNQKKEELEREYQSCETLPTPSNWGGYRVEPSTIEFWQGRSNRLHDRFRFRKTNNLWHIERLAP